MKSLEEMEKEHIIEVLHQTNWNRSKTARILGIDRKTLYDKMKRYEINKSE
jgi:transcriptional regulator of acetoin/glycerol metabolism